MIFIIVRFLFGLFGDKLLHGIYGDVWRCVEICGDVWRYVEICGILWRCVEICGDMWRCVEICGDTNSQIRQIKRWQ